MPDDSPQIPPSDLEARLCHRFRQPELLALALTHPSCAQESAQTPTNQRLEFLGDAVLGFILADALYHTRPDDREGALTKARSALARGKYLSELARNLGIPDALRMSDAEREQGGHLRPAALEDALEAVIGAIYLDGGMAAAKTCVLGWIGDIGQTLEAMLRKTNAKGQLQEWLQGQSLPTPEYRLTHTEGPPHDRHYRVEVWFGGQLRGNGNGPSIKTAEEAAATEAMQGIRTAE